MENGRVMVMALSLAAKKLEQASNDRFQAGVRPWSHIEKQAELSKWVDHFIPICEKKVNGLLTTKPFALLLKGKR